MSLGAFASKSHKLAAFDMNVSQTIVGVTGASFAYERKCSIPVAIIASRLQSKYAPKLKLTSRPM